ncbi:hypothetical protein J7E62_02720 [Variovorax paradoxus]|nr:hypothetical protein [Variovorax paradoxus]
MAPDPVDHYKGLPRRIHVGPTTFRVVVGTAELHPCLTDCCGITVFEEYRIYLHDGMLLQAAVNTVIHEVSHAINWVYGVTDDSTEEQFVTQNSNGLVEVWMRNPRLLNWIVKQLRAMKKEAARD